MCRSFRRKVKKLVDDNITGHTARQAAKQSRAAEATRAKQNAAKNAALRQKQIDQQKAILAQQKAAAEERAKLLSEQKAEAAAEERAKLLSEQKAAAEEKKRVEDRKKRNRQSTERVARNRQRRGYRNNLFTSVKGDTGFGANIRRATKLGG